MTDVANDYNLGVIALLDRARDADFTQRELHLRIQRLILMLLEATKPDAEYEALEEMVRDVAGRLSGAAADEHLKYNPRSKTFPRKLN